MNNKSKNRQSLKTKVTLQKKILVGLSLTFVISAIGYLYFYFGNAHKSTAANPLFTSVNERTRLWENGNAWQGGVVPPGNADFSIEGYITRTANLSLANEQSLIVNVEDTLILKQDLSLANKGILSVKNKAVLVVRGNYSSDNKSNDVVESGGTMIVIGKITFSNAPGTNIIIKPGSNFYYDMTLNGSDVASRITGGGTASNLSAMPYALYPPATGETQPVSITSFTPKVIKDMVALNWEVSEESGINYYEVQSSTDGVNFNSLGKVLPTENGQASKNYSYTDKNPYAGHSFYRLLISDERNEIYSNIIEVKITGRSGIIIYPNPSDGIRMGIMGNNIRNKVINILVYDPSGKQVFTNKIQMDNEDSYEVDFNHRLNNGRYIVHFVYDNHTEKKSLLVSE